MKAKFAPDLTDTVYGSFSSPWDDPNSSFFFFLPAVDHNGGSRSATVPPIVLTPAPSSEAVAAEDAQNGLGSVVAVTSAGGITFNLLFDAAAMTAPASFRTGIEQAAALLGAAISDKITVNIKIDYRGPRIIATDRQAPRIYP
jgi:hypothetical protein